MTRDQEKSYEELQQETLKRLQNQEYLTEIAMPGISIPVKTDK